MNYFCIQRMEAIIFPTANKLLEIQTPKRNAFPVFITKHEKRFWILFL